MKKIFSLAVCIFVVVLSLSCGIPSQTATSTAHPAGTKKPLTPTAQHGTSNTKPAPTKGSGLTPADTATQPPLAATDTAEPSGDAPVLLGSGSGSGDVTVSAYQPFFNLHVVTANGTATGSWPTIASFKLLNVAIKDWATGNVVLGERWFAIRTPLPVGKYAVKIHGGASWEIWSVGAPPLSFSVHSVGNTMQAGVADYFFKIDRAGVYQVKMDIVSGSYVLYFGCGYTGMSQYPRQLVTYNQAVTQSGSFETSFTTGICFLEVATAPNSVNPQWKISLSDTGK